MTEATEFEELPYLLDQMAPGRRASFEQRLESDERARAELKVSAEALARFAGQTAPAEPMQPADQRAALAAILQATRGSAPARSRPRTWGARERWFWPVAAGLLLALNLLHFDRPVELSSAAARPADPPPSHEPATGPLAPTRAGDAAGSSAETERLETLQREHGELQQQVAALQAEREAVVSYLEGVALLEGTFGRLAAMELVDGEAYERGARWGLMEIARSLLMEPGVIVPDLTAPAVRLVPEGADAVPAAPPPPPAAPGTSAGSAVDRPYAWNVYDHLGQQGRLNLYHLPVPGPEESLQLWIKPVGATDFQRVAEVPPDYHGRSGTVSYRLAGPGVVPGEILITRESGTPPSAPSGPVVLRGP